MMRDVAPFAGAWIEITLLKYEPIENYVAPFAGAWIEISLSLSSEYPSSSLPSRERGLKFLSFSLLSLLPHVAPFAGAWIEIDKEEEKEEDKESLPSRERGLK